VLHNSTTEATLHLAKRIKKHRNDITYATLHPGMHSDSKIFWYYNMTHNQEDFLLYNNIVIASQNDDTHNIESAVHLYQDFIV
jgi:hypothetical protein